MIYIITKITQRIVEGTIVDIPTRIKINNLIRKMYIVYNN